LIKTLTPLHVGGYGESFETDLPLARDGVGRFYVPGTSLAGSLRSWCEQAFEKELTDALWGFQKDEKGHASYVIVEDALVKDPDGNDISPTGIEIRDGVGIDRVWGRAADHIKFDRAILPRGSQLSLKMTVDIPIAAQNNKYRVIHSEEAQVMLGQLLRALERGEIGLGAARTRGLGKVQLIEPCEVRKQERNSREGILAVLRGQNQTLAIDQLLKVESPVAVAPRPRLEIEIKWRPRGPLMVKSGADGIGVDMLPLVSANGSELAMALPGSSVKGALRSQAERIVRTVCGLRAEREGDSKKRFLKQLDEVPLVQELFGARAKSKDEKQGEEQKPKPNEKESKEPVPGLGALSARDCFARQSLSKDRWRELTTLSEKSPEATQPRTLQQALDEVKRENRGDFAQAFHVAIDRWTGGAAEQMLYTVLEPMKIDWEPLTLHLDLTRFPKRETKLRDAAIALLLLTLRDLAEGRIPLGFAVNHGMGEVAVDEINVKGFDLDRGEDTSLSKLTAISALAVTDANRLREQLGEDLFTRINQSWKDWQKRPEQK
jgi:CRISPR/Cas system CSM-associated protein Csm3 (group 7 of RAMP superfamily)